MATLEGRLNYLLLTGGQPARAAIGLAALLDARGWGETAALVMCSRVKLPAASGNGRTKADAEMQAKAWLDELTHGAVHGLVKAWGPASRPAPRFQVIAPPAP